MAVLSLCDIDTESKKSYKSVDKRVRQLHILSGDKMRDIMTEWDRDKHQTILIGILCLLLCHFNNLLSQNVRAGVFQY